MLLLVNILNNIYKFESMSILNCIRCIVIIIDAACVDLQAGDLEDGRHGRSRRP